MKVTKNIRAKELQLDYEVFVVACACVWSWIEGEQEIMKTVGKMARQVDAGSVSLVVRKAEGGTKR